MTEHPRLALGAYVLGQLGPDEAREVESHLAGCAACRGELDEIAPASIALRELRAAGPQLGPGEPPIGLDDRVLGAIEQARRVEERRRWLRSASLAGVAAAAAAVVIVGGFALVESGRTTPAPQASTPLEAVPVTVEQPGVTASADIVAHTWGVEVKLDAVGFTVGSRYRVAVVGDDGQRHSAGEFVGTGSREMRCNLNSSVLRTQAEGFEVRNSAGVVVAVSHFR